MIINCGLDQIWWFLIKICPFKLRRRSRNGQNIVSKRNVISKIYLTKYVWPVFLSDKLTSRRGSDFELLSTENIIYGQDPFILLSYQIQVLEDPDVRLRNTRISTEFWGVSKNDKYWPHFIRREKSSPVEGPYVETLSEMKT